MFTINGVGLQYEFTHLSVLIYWATTAIKGRRGRFVPKNLNCSMRFLYYHDCQSNESGANVKALGLSIPYCHYGPVLLRMVVIQLLVPLYKERLFVSLISLCL